MAVACINPGRPTAVTGDSRGLLHVWDLNTHMATRLIQARSGIKIHYLACFEVSDASRTVAVYEDGRVDCWDLESGTLLMSLATGGGVLNAAVGIWDYAQPALITGHRDGFVRAWDLNSGHTLSEFRVDSDAYVVDLTHFGAQPCAVVAPAPDFGDVLEDDFDPEAEVEVLQVWDLVSGICIKRLFGRYEVTDVATYHQDGQIVVALGAEFGWLQLWDLEKGQQTQGWDATDGAAVAFALDWQSGTVLTADATTLRLWDVHQGRTVATLEVPGGSLSEASCVSDGHHRLVIAGSTDGSVHMWDVPMTSDPATIDHQGGKVTAQALLQDRGHLLVLAGTEKGMLELWDLHGGKRLLTHRGHHGEISGLTCVETPDSWLVVSSGHDGWLRVWEPRTGRLHWETFDRDQSITSLSTASIAGDAIALAGYVDGYVQTWVSLDAPTRPTPLGRHNRRVRGASIVASGGQSLAVTGADGGELLVWNLADRSLRQRIHAHDGRVNAVDTTKVGDRLVAVSASSDRTARVWDLATGALIHELVGHESWLTGVACTSIGGGPTAITGGNDGSVRAWDLTHGQLVAVFQTTGRVTALCTDTEGDVCLALGREILHLDRLSGKGGEQRS